MKCFSIEARGRIAEVHIFDEIGSGGTTAKAFADEVKKIGNVSRINLRINSPGGSVFDGNAIYNTLRKHKASVHVEIEGIALSMGSVIAMAGDHISMAENALMMIHNPWGGAIGDADELRKTADVMDKTKQSILSAYVRKTGKPAEEISAMMDAESWFTAEEALEQGFVDEVTDQLEIAASFDPTKFTNIPDNILKRLESMKTSTVSKDAILATEKNRRDDIRVMFSVHDGYDEMLNKCLDDPSIDLAKAGEMLLNEIGKHNEPLGGIGGPRFENGHDSMVDFKNAATDALLVREGVTVADPHPGARDLSRMSVVSMAETMLKQRGFSTRGMSGSKLVMKAMHSTSDFPSILSNVAGKALMQGYSTEPRTHAIWTRSVDVADFKTQTRDQLSEAPSLNEVKEGGEYTHGSFGENKEEYNITTFGRLFSITRQALINDDLSAFTRLPNSFGASASRREADVVYGILTANAAMNDGTALFHADHSNLESAAALSIASLGSARKAMRVQTGLNGLATLNIVPRYLIVPAALETTAEQLLASLVDPTKSNDTPNLAFIRGLTLVVDARLDADSETAWYLAADWGQVDTIERAYLEGARGVSYEERPGWEIDGMEVKARLDFGAQVIDHRGLLKNPGA